MKSIQLTDQVYEAIRFAALNAGMKDEVDFLRQFSELLEAISILEHP